MNIPSEIWIQIMLKLDGISLRMLSQVNKRLYQVSQEQSLWQRVCLLEESSEVQKYTNAALNYKERYVLGYRNKVRIMRHDFTANRIARDLLFDISRLEIRHSSKSTSIRYANQIKNDGTLLDCEVNRSIEDHQIINTGRVSEHGRSSSLCTYESNLKIHEIQSESSRIIFPHLKQTRNIAASEIIPRITQENFEYSDIRKELLQNRVFQTWDDYTRSKKERQKTLFSWISDFVIVEQ